MHNAVITTTIELIIGCKGITSIQLERIASTIAFLNLSLNDINQLTGICMECFSSAGLLSGSGEVNISGGWGTGTDDIISDGFEDKVVNRADLVINNSLIYKFYMKIT